MERPGRLESNSREATSANGTRKHAEHCGHDGRREDRGPGAFKFASCGRALQLSLRVVRRSGVKMIEAGIEPTTACV